MLLHESDIVDRKRIVQVTGDEVTARLAAENRRRTAAQLLHYSLKLFGYLEFSEVYGIGLDPLPPPRRLDGYTLDRANSDDIDTICRELVRDEPPIVLRNLWAGGNHCFVARKQDRIVGYDWLAFPTVQEEEYRVELRPDHAFCLNAYTVPEHRGRGIHYALLRNMLEFAAQNGKSKAYTLVSLFNRDSWKSHIRMGWKREFTYCYFRPYFTPRRMPWPLTSPRYPVRLDWPQHSWFAPTATSPPG
jgi:GNAT superfamily N-acetyltransferase